MTTSHTLRCYDYVNHSYERVCEALRRDATGIFRRATTKAATRASVIGAQLHVQIGMLDVATDVGIEVGAPYEAPSPTGPRVTAFPLSWQSASRPGLFPHMNARLLVFPLSATETQLELEGSYEPPLGLLGAAVDALVGHRVAEACVLSFVQDIAALLRGELPNG
jgi:hypothetical protein